MKKVWKKLFCAGITVFGGTALFLRMIGETQWLTLGTVFLAILLSFRPAMTYYPYAHICNYSICFRSTYYNALKCKEILIFESYRKYKKSFFFILSDKKGQVPQLTWNLSP